MVRMLLQNMQAQQQLMQLTLSIQSGHNYDTPIYIPRAKIDFPKWETNFALGIYHSRVDAFIANTLPSLAGKILIDP